MKAHWIGSDSNTPTDTTSESEQQKEQIKNQKKQRELQEKLFSLEHSIFYKKHLSPMNTIRERTAFFIAIAGLCGSFVTPFKLVKGSPQHPFATLGRRLAVMATTLCFTTTAACAISFLRPILWYQEYRAERLKKKIFDLHN